MSPGRFASDLALFVGLALIIALPVLVLAYRRGETRMVRAFLLAGVAVGVVIAALSVTSDALVRRCVAAGNTGCLDYGAVGIETLILVVYAIATVIAAVRLIRD